MISERQAWHNRHIETKRYEFGQCEVCRALLLEALANHRSHSMRTDGSHWVYPEHTNQECVSAYIEHGRRMSAS